MLTLILFIIVVFLALSVLLGCIEARSGTLGDSSMVPSLLLLMVVVVAGIIVGGFLTGHITLFFN
jgi:hypothetical protein